MSEDDGKWSCEARCVGEKPLSILCEMEDGTRRWIPKSIVHDDSEVYNADENDEGELVLKWWWAEQEGLT